MEITNDPYKDFCRHDAEQQKWLNSRPVCYSCGDPIQDDTCYCFNNHKYCLDCWHEAAEDILPEFLEATV